jgi:hypothetical protein
MHQGHLSGNAFYQTPRLQALLAASYQRTAGLEGTYRWNPVR